MSVARGAPTDCATSDVTSATSISGEDAEDFERGGGVRAGRREGAEAWSDAVLARGLRAGDDAAMAELVRRFHPLLMERARHEGVPAAARHELVFDVLTDAAARLRASRERAPRSLGVYLIATLRYQLRNERRKEQRRELLARRASAPLSGSGEYAVLGVCSEATLRAAEGPAWERPAPRPVLAALSNAMREALDDDEWRLIGWMASDIPSREIAEWLGTSSVAVRKRVQRLRMRLVGVALHFMEGCSADDRAWLQRRFGVRLQGGRDERGLGTPA
jgi:DNA-directed RNA polymerase specialized sigma24 family protein